jgi:hypothetical protein
MDKCDGRFSSPLVYRLPAKIDFSRCGRVNARKHLDQGRLARAISAEQREHFMNKKIKRDIVDCAISAKMFDHIFKSEQRHVSPWLEFGRCLSGRIHFLRGFNRDRLIDWA